MARCGWRSGAGARRARAQCARAQPDAGVVQAREVPQHVWCMAPCAISPKRKLCSANTSRHGNYLVQDKRGCMHRSDLELDGRMRALSNPQRVGCPSRILHGGVCCRRMRWLHVSIVIAWARLGLCCLKAFYVAWVCSPGFGC